MRWISLFSVLVSFYVQFSLGNCDLTVNLEEVPAGANSQATLATVDSQPHSGPISLVVGHTYHITCQDTANSRVFDDEGVEAWHFNGSPVLVPDEIPEGGVNTVYTSTEVSMQANEWTLVLQEFSEQDVGVYSCHGLEEGQVVSLTIQHQSNLAVIASNPQHELKAGTIRSFIVLSPFISSATTVSSRWLFNGNASAFPSGVGVQGSQVILNSPITGTMRGVYTCEVTSEGGFTATAVYNISVSVSPQVIVTPPLTRDQVAFAGALLNVSCEDSTGFPLAEVLWYRNGTVLTDQGGRVSVTGVLTSLVSSATLVIDPVMSSDVGEYSCSSQNLVATSEQTFALVQVLEISVYLEKYAWLVGDTLVFQVQLANSDPVQTFQLQWTRDNSPVPEGSRFNSMTRTDGDLFVIELRVGVAVVGDSGVYQCHITTPMGVQVVTFDPVTIYGVTVTSTTHPNDLGLYPGLNLDLTCSVSISSDTDRSQLSNMTAMWMRSGDPLVGSHDRITTTGTVEVGDSMRSYLSNVSFSPLQLQDEGAYVCTVTSRLNSGDELVLNHSTTLLFDYMLFQMRLLEVGSCQDWVNAGSKEKADEVIATVISAINTRCPSCQLSTNHITAALFRCFPESPQAVTFRAYLLGRGSTPSSEMVRYVEAWLQEDGMVPIDVVLTVVDQSCPVEIELLSDPECDHTLSDTPVQSQGIPLVIVVGVASGVGVLLILLMGVVITVVIVMVSSRNRRMMAVMEEKRGSSPLATLNAVNPSLPGVSYGSAPPDEEPQYEEIDKYDYPRKKGTGEESYEKMRAVQIMPTIHGLNSNSPEYDYAAV